MKQLQPWFLFSATAVALWATVNILDKLLVANYVKSKEARLFLDTSIGLIGVVAIYYFTPEIPIFMCFLGLISGALLCLFNYLYYKAIEVVNISTASLLLQIVPIITAVIGYLFFKETFELNIYFAILLILLGGIFFDFLNISMGNIPIFSRNKFHFFSFYMLPSVVILSIIYSIHKYMLQSIDIWSVFVWGRMGAFIPMGVMLLYDKKIRKDVESLLQNASAQTILMIVFVEWLNLTGIYFILCAFALGSLTLVTIVAGLQPVLIILLSFPVKITIKERNISKFFPKWKKLSLRGLATVLLCVGIIIIAFY